MAFPERRWRPRVATSLLVAFFLINKKGTKIGQGVGKTIAISQKGILIETSRAIAAPYVLVLAHDLDDNTIEISGNVVYSREISPGIFECGIDFRSEPAQNVIFRRDPTRAFHFRDLFSRRYWQAERLRTGGGHRGM